MKKLISILYFLSSLPLLAQQENAIEIFSFYNGNTFYSKCFEQQNPLIKAQCNDYIRGALDGISNMQVINKDFCIFKWPRDGTIDQFTDVVLKFLKENPDKRASSAAFLIILSLHQSFPCPSK